MHQLSCKRNIVPKLVLSVLYFLFFAVQLNLRYQSIDISRASGSSSYSPFKQTIAQSKVSVNECADSKSPITTRLNKRYFPGFFYLVQSPVLPSGVVVYLKKNSSLQPNPFLLEQHAQFAQRRGPPSVC